MVRYSSGMQGETLNKSISAGYKKLRVAHGHTPEAAHENELKTRQPSCYGR